MSTPDLPNETTRRRGTTRWVLLILSTAALAGLALTWLRWRQSGNTDSPPAVGVEAPTDPRLSYTGPFKNIHPDVRYVGDDHCVDCHIEYAESYARHPMGRSMGPIGELADRQAYDAAHGNPFDALGMRLRVERQGERVWHCGTVLVDGKPIVEARQEVHYAVGSGTRGYSYLAVVDGYVFQTGISWYSQKKIWDRSPGFPLFTTPGRPIPPGCLQCHVNSFRRQPGYQHRFEAKVFQGYAIGCERCHGPGQKHVEARERGDPIEGDFDDTIVNPRHLSWQLRENICEQCHLGGLARFPRRGRDWLDYRPGLPLEAFFATFVLSPEQPGKHKAVSQLEEMYLSECFRKSTGKDKMGCISCHDPHEKPDPSVRVSYFRQRCLACHQERGCALHLGERWRQVPGDSCIDCHMPRRDTTDIAHTALTDHRIIRPGRERVNLPGLSSRFGTMPVVNFYRDRLNANDPEVRRDLGIGLAIMLQSKRIPQAFTAQATEQALTLLPEALERAPDDVDGWLAHGTVRQMVGQDEQAQDAFERVVQLAPNNEQALGSLAELAQKHNRPEEALRYWRRLVEVNPYSIGARHSLAIALGQSGDWAGAVEQARARLKMDPISPAGWQMLVLSLWSQGKKAEARREFETLRRLRPVNLAELEAWFARLGD